MKNFGFAIAALIAISLPAHAGCYVDYKAKMDDPLRLHYGVAEVAACDKVGAEAELSGRLAAAGWVLLNVIGVFGPEGLEERKASAAEYFLRF